MASSLRREHLSSQGADLRSAVSQPSETYDLTTEQVRRGQPSDTVTEPLFVFFDGVLEIYEQEAVTAINSN